mgnify:CR=1 FL=1
MVVHLLVGPPPPAGAARDAADGSPAPLVGFVVSKAVGGSVVRNRVERRLRHLVREHLAALPPGSRVVVRANPAAASATHEQLDRDLVGAIDRLTREAPAGGPRRSRS